MNLIDELPENIQGLKLYIAYAEKQIKLNIANSKRLSKLIELAHEKIKLKIGDQNGKTNNPKS